VADHAILRGCVYGPSQPLVRAPGIVAEILFYREAVKKIGADSPIFGATRQKDAQIPNYKLQMSF
jgi:hypothetical protein